MKADLRAEFGLLNRNVFEMIRLFERAMDAALVLPKKLRGM